MGEFSAGDFKKGQYITVEGQEADRFYIIRKGKVKITKEIQVLQEPDGGIHGPGDFFGVISAMSGHLQIENTMADEDTGVIIVMANQFEGMVRTNPAVAFKIIQYFSKRMRYLDHALAALSLKSMGEASMASQLYKTAQFYYSTGDLDTARYCYTRYADAYSDGPDISAVNTWLNKNGKDGGAVKTTAQGALYPKGRIIFAEGEPGDTLYVIQTGSVKITKVVDGKEMVLAVLRSGEMFGEMALLDSKPRSAGAFAHEDSALTPVNKGDFERISREMPRIIVRLTKILAERLWFMDKQLANATLTDPSTRFYDGIVMNLEKDDVPDQEGKSWTFNFGIDELLKMVTIPPEMQGSVVSGALYDKNLREVNGKLYVNDVRAVRQQRNIMVKKAKMK
jgi:CRP-like cAMP-binding protein